MIGTPPFPSVDFERFHREDLPGLLEQHAEVIAHRPEGLAPIALAVGGSAVTYRPTADGIEVVAGGDGAHTVVDLTAEGWTDFVHELRSAFGLTYAGLAPCSKGKPEWLMRWEATLRAAWVGRDPSPPTGGRVDDTPDLASELAVNGFALVPGVFTADEVAAMGDDVERLTALARPDDRRSWWARTADGDAVCCRLLYTGEGSDVIPAIAGDGRLDALLAPTGETVRLAADRFDGLSVVMKPPRAVEGLADLPWHRDCGLGGHPVMCPEFNVGIQLDAATADTGQLEFLAGSHASGWWPEDPNDVGDLPVVRVDTEPGDVTVHYGHVLHRAGPPAGEGGRRALYATYVQDLAFDYVGPGQAINDVLFGTGLV